MALKKFDKITDAQLKSMGVSALADKPNALAASQYGQSGLSATLLKAWFDKLGIHLSERLNQIIDMLSTEKACEHIAIPDGIIAFNVSNSTSLLDFLLAFSSGEIAYQIRAFKNESAKDLMPLQFILYEIAASLSGHQEYIDIHGGMISDLSETIRLNAEMCSSNSKDADGNIVSHKEILSEVEELRCELASDRSLIPGFVVNTVAEHNGSSVAHADIRTNVATALEKAQEAYNLASGKSKVHPLLDFAEFVYYAKTEPDRYNVGDVIMFDNKLFPDFVLFAKNVSFEYDIDDYEITGETLDGTEELAPGKSFIIGNMRFITIESGIDVSKFVKNDEYQTDKSNIEQSGLPKMKHSLKKQKNLQNRLYLK